VTGTIIVFAGIRLMFKTSSLSDFINGRSVESRSGMTMLEMFALATDAVPVFKATITQRPIRQIRASHTVLIMRTPGGFYSVQAGPSATDRSNFLNALPASPLGFAAKPIFIASRKIQQASFLNWSAPLADFGSGLFALKIELSICGLPTQTRSGSLQWTGR
jgi:hypothetical protein